MSSNEALPSIVHSRKRHFAWKMLPRADRAPPGSSIQHEFDVQFQRAQCSQEMSRFALTTTPSTNLNREILAATEEKTMALPFAKTASYCGFANYISVGRNPTIDNAPHVRALPWPAVPADGSFLACAAMNVDTWRIVVEPNRIILPKPDGTQTIIPVHDVRSDSSAPSRCSWTSPGSAPGRGKTCTIFQRTAGRFGMCRLHFVRNCRHAEATETNQR